MRRLGLAITTLGLCIALVPAATAAPSPKKAIWGPPAVDGVSQFPIYDDLGVGIYQISVAWSDVAPTRPAKPNDPTDPAYRWPEAVDYALREADRYGIAVSIQLGFAPPWANGGRGPEWAPRNARDFAAFAEAAARRYPAVRHWQVWGEPTKRRNFRPLVTVRRDVDAPLRGRAAEGPRLYARILDASYVALKGVDPGNLVVGGNTFTTGDVKPKQFIQTLRLPSGRPPRMDLWGHNPFAARKPDLRKSPIPGGFADFSDLDTLADWLDRHQRLPGRRPLRLFLSEYTAPTDHRNREFNFYVTQQVQAEWLSAAFRITRRSPRIYTLGWHALYDEAPNGRGGGHGDDVHRGLLDYRGQRKPSYAAFRRG